MVRLTNKSGAIVDVPEEKVARLGSEWSAVETPEKRGPGRPKKVEESEKSDD